MARTNRTWSRTTWHPTPGTEITVTGLNPWETGGQEVTHTLTVLGTGRTREASLCGRGISTRAMAELAAEEYVGSKRGQTNDYIDILAKDSDGNLWRVNACMGEIPVTESLTHTWS